MRRPWWNRPSWTNHVTTGPAAEATRPRQERCGIPAGEQVAWLEMTAHLGVDLDPVARQAIADQEWLESATDIRAKRGGTTDRVAWVLIAAAAILIVIGVLL